jgi:CRISPR-associated protein Cmr5
MNSKPAHIRTNRQAFAERAFQRIKARRGTGEAEYARIAKRFPSLIHNCGLAQAVAFLQAKSGSELLGDLAFVVHGSEQTHGVFAEETRNADLGRYLLLTQQALEASTWLKRYAEAVLASNEVGKP